MDGDRNGRIVTHEWAGTQYFSNKGCCWFDH